MNVYTYSEAYVSDGTGSETEVLGGVRIKPTGVDDGFPSRACSVVTCLYVKLNIFNVL